MHWYISTQRYIILDKCSPFIQVYRQADEDEDVHDSNGLLIVVGAKKTVQYDFKLRGKKTFQDFNCLP